MCQLPVATDDEFAPLVANFLQVRAQQRVKLVLAYLDIGIAVCDLGRQQAGHAQVLVVRLDVAPFHVEVGKAQPRHDGFREFAAVDRDTVGLAVDVIEEVGVVFLWEVQVVLQVVLRTPQVLDAYEIRILICQPVEKSLFCGAWQAVSAETDDPHL